MFKFTKQHSSDSNWFSRHWEGRRERFYLKNRWRLVLDFSLVIIIILLIAAVIVFHFYRPNVVPPLNSGTDPKTVLDLNNPPLILDFSLSDSSLRLSEGLEFKINLKNNSNLLIRDIKLKLLTTDKNFVVSKIKDVNSTSSQIRINNQQIEVSLLGANETREIPFMVYFQNKSEQERIVKWQIQNEYFVQGQSIKEVVNLPDLQLAAELKAQAEIYYNSPQGDELGSGPLPPVISLPTNYWVFFEIKSFGDFKNLVFSAKLPKGVELTDRRSLLSGDFKYNASSRQVIWSVPELKNQSDSYRVGFEIQFIPTESQLGKIAPLLTNLKYYASDRLINEENYGELADLTTNLDFDRINKGQGEVVLP